ncbi:MULTISPECIES: DUF5325 family protein [Lysinibacillus]|uniref:YlaF family protein n=1 Tax=Lysinibacillus antri TaxID=2498145 RepID=A0A3S0R627_9BACI|nr:MULTISPECIES: DUF5325 family protein [Lysinibacillus]RUL51912.1 hypothetical protein EK386_11255 [Lysinibacillus antri]TSI09290.1 hypothetical protein FJQ64_05185 [Lysinibacillus sp. BW-2-10]
MNKAKMVMFIFAVAAILSMISIGYAIAIKSVIAAIAGLVALCVVMMTGFKMKRKFQNQGLL